MIQTCFPHLYVQPTPAHALLTHSHPLSFFNPPMEKLYLPPKRQLSTPPPPPSPIPTGKGSRSAADPVLSEYVDKSIRIPQLKLPQRVHRTHQFNPDEIDYRSIVSRDNDSVGKLLRSVREFGFLQINDHGIDTEELRFALGNSDRIFGLTVENCTSYGDHEKIIWHGHERRMVEEAAAAIGERNYRIFRQTIENVAKQLESIAKELAAVFAQNGRKQFQEPIQLQESSLSIYRYHRANIIDRRSSVFGETSQESSPYALSLHLLLEPSEFCLESGWGILSFDTKPDTIVVTMGKELEERRRGEFRSAQGKFMVKPFMHTNRPSFSIEQKWSFSNLGVVVGKSDKIISLWDQIFILLLMAVLFNSFPYIFS